MTEPAPLYHDLANGPEGGRAFWLRCSDGMRIRAAYWPGGSKGTVLLFPGRSEYVEKYGPAATEMSARGYATVTLDWRGQGLSDRALPDPMAGHVGDFSEYQLDVEAVLALADSLGFPRPFHLLSHSMGGCIGLRSLMQGLPVNSTAFSAPMWGIRISRALRPIAVTLSNLSRYTRQYHRYAPSTSAVSYVAAAPFQDNVLTTDPDMYAWMKSQISAMPGLSLGGPTLGWLHAALTECSALATLPSPEIAALCVIGDREKVVDVPPIHLRMAAWPKGQLDVYPRSEHEIPMERPATRQRFYDGCASLFDANSDPKA